MASVRPSSRYSSMDSRSSSTSSHNSDPSPSSSDVKNPSKNLSSLKRLITNASGRHHPSDPLSAMETSSRALIKTRSGDLAPARTKNAPNFGTMVRKFMEKKSNPKPSSTGRTALIIPADPIAEDLKKTTAGKGSNFSALHRKLFQKGGSADRTAVKALTEVKANTRTLAMVLRSERELLSQNKEYETEISQLHLLVEEKNREIEKLKDLCLKQREEIKALKDAILFPDVMNTQLHDLLQKQGTELNQARRIIPSLQKQVTSLTGQIQCLAEDLAEVKADKYAVRTCFDGHVSSPQTPTLEQEIANPLEYSSVDPMTSGYDSPDDMFLKDLNPCLTPCFSKNRSKDYDEMLAYDSQDRDSTFCKNTELNSDLFSSPLGGMLSKSSEYCQRPSLGSSTSQKIYKSDESEWSAGKPKHHNCF